MINIFLLWLIIVIELKQLELFYLNPMEQLFQFVQQLCQLEVCLPTSRLLTGILILLVFQNLRWNSNKTSPIILQKDFIENENSDINKLLGRISSKLCPCSLLSPNFGFISPTTIFSFTISYKSIYSSISTIAKPQIRCLIFHFWTWFKI